MFLEMELTFISWRDTVPLHFGPRAGFREFSKVIYAKDYCS
jgi:hypothetical protein